MNDHILRQEIAEDPTGIGYQDRPDIHVARLLNEETQQKFTPVLMSAVFSLLFEKGALLKLYESDSGPARTMRLVLQSHRADTMDVHSPAFLRMLDGLVEDGVIDPEDRDVILGWGTKLVSRAHLLGLGTVEYWDVGRVRSVD